MICSVYSGDATDECSCHRRQGFNLYGSSMGGTEKGTLKHIDTEQFCKLKKKEKRRGVKRLKMMLDEIGRERGSEEDGGGRVLQTRCSQAHTSSLCSDLLSVWILFRSNRPLKKRFCLIFLCKLFMTSPEH